MSIWKNIKKPIKVLAPMAGYTDSTFRQVCRNFGADITITELISADAIYFALKKGHHPEKSESHPAKKDCHPELVSGSHQVNDKFESSKTYQLLKFSNQERPLVVQLFGKDPEKFLVAARFIESELKPDGIDVNMGCSVRKVLKSGHGAALLKNEQQAIEIVRTLKANIKLPISVKTRLGYDDPSQILNFGPKLKEAGADALIVHGRTVKQGFSGSANWEPIYELKKLLPGVIVIGNGNIDSYSKINQMIGNLDGVAIGRAALGQPWIFSQEERPAVGEIIKLVKKQAQITFENKGRQGIVELRKHLIWYFKGMENAVELRKKLVAVEGVEDVINILDSLEAA